jgi:hypothetical protein
MRREYKYIYIYMYVIINTIDPTLTGASSVTTLSNTGSEVMEVRAFHFFWRHRFVGQNS